MLQSIRDLDLVDYDLFIPVPIHPSRRRFRGFNQSELLSERLPAERLRPDLLRRVRATLPQASLSPEQRRTNLKGAFSATAEVLGAHIVLIDDVLTSGTTALECAKALKEAGAREVVAVAFAGG
jgi:ComF family protein